MNPFKTALFGLALAGLGAGLLGPAEWRIVALQAGSGLVLAVLIREIALSLWRGEFGLDFVAALSISAALTFGEPLAASVVALMYAGGQLLEDYAASRAKAEMTALLGRLPKTALRYTDGELELCNISGLVPGDRLLVRQGDVVPADGIVHSGTALLDLSALTGESVPVKRAKGEDVPSGSANMDVAFDLRVVRRAEDSAYSAIVSMVKAAQEAKAPSVRLADRYAVWFLFFTLLLAGAAWWASGDKLRMLAVLVVATPCPLILAVPVALISGLSRAAHRGVLLKGGDVLERLAKARVLVADKTGTLTTGHAALVRVDAQRGFDAKDVLRLAASLDQASAHAIAVSIVKSAREAGAVLSEPRLADETAGEGVTGKVDGKRVAIGGAKFVSRTLRGRRLPRRTSKPGEVLVAVAAGGKFAGWIVLADQLRSDAGAALDALRQAGIFRVVLASGDSANVVDRIASDLGIEHRHGDMTPEDKVRLVTAERANGPVIMAGDGVNDAPALAAADVGIAMGARGSAASAEAADAILLSDNLRHIGDAVRISQRALAIAKQSVIAGLGLSAVAMFAAAFGYLPPVQGAQVQEAIDVAVILNALRALR
ncbi:MAG: cadmium-translocating P-type ATPase [Rhizobiales bacterium]|nr:cadmium-translocating P-type ATPase [Hyphomicrobiales bacterium]